MYSMNESFADNMTGKKIKFDIQPYSRGSGTITKVTPRMVQAKHQWMMPYGRVNMVYEVFDLEVLVETGTHTGALVGGVPVSNERLDGRMWKVTGVSYEQLWNAVGKDEIIIIALCG